MKFDIQTDWDDEGKIDALQREAIAWRESVFQKIKTDITEKQWCKMMKQGKKYKTTFEQVRKKNAEAINNFVKVENKLKEMIEAGK